MTFECSGSGGRPSTNETTLTTDDTRVQLATGYGSVNHTLEGAQCDDSGTYTCTAGNDMGLPARTSATLYVNCKYIVDVA